MNGRDAAIVSLTQAGWSGPAIAAKFGISKRTVERVRRRAGIARPLAAKFTSDEIRLAESLLADGASYGEVGRTLGRHQPVITRKFPNRSTWKPGSGRQAAALYAALGQVNA